MGSYTPQVPVASRTPPNQQSASGVGALTLQGGIEIVHYRLRPQYVN